MPIADYVEFIKSIIASAFAEDLEHPPNPLELTISAIAKRRVSEALDTYRAAMAQRGSTSLPTRLRARVCSPWRTSPLPRQRPRCGSRPRRSTRPRLARVRGSSLRA
jgi:hypothetical protein